MEWALFDGNPVGFHVVNVILHSAVTVLVVLLVGEILPLAGALLAGLLFAVHPVHVEAVANVVGMAEILAAVFFLWACVLILRGGERMTAGRLMSVLVLYALAFLTKESAVTLLGVVLLLDCSKRDVHLKDLPAYLARRWPLYGGMVLIAGLVLLGRFWVLGSLAHPYPPLGARILAEIPRIWTVAATWPHILRLLFFPLDLSVDYGPAVISVAYGWEAVNVLGAVLVLGILGLALATWGRGVLGVDRSSSRALGWGVVWFVITFSPTSNLLFLSGILLAERTLYLPSVGFVVAAAWALIRLWEVRPRLAVTVVLAALVFGVGRTWTRTPTWKDNLEVFHTLTSEHPEAGRSQWVMGDSYFTMGRVKEGLRAYRVAVGLVGDSYNLLIGVSRNLIGTGFPRPAELLLKRAWEQRPEYGVAPGLLAHVYQQQGRYTEAAAAARYSISRDSTDASQYHTLAQSLQAQGLLDEAVEARKGAIRMGEGDHIEQWVWLAELHLQRGDTVGARTALDSASLRVNSTPVARQFDSVLVALGFRRP
jgi:cytochrome c-type biogenesis protein CcmH/NrfG